MSEDPRAPNSRHPSLAAREPEPETERDSGARDRRMRYRRIALAPLLVLILGLSVWLVLMREGPQQRILRWRSDVLQALFESPPDLTRAEERSARILELLPGSVPDLVLSAHVSERKGTEAGYREAVAIYDAILAGGDSRLLPVGVWKARLLRAIGNRAEARALLLSIADGAPYEAFFELGEMALAEFSSAEAARCFAAARDCADQPLLALRAEDALASAGVQGAWLRRRRGPVVEERSGEASPGSPGEVQSTPGGGDARPVSPEAAAIERARQAFRAETKSDADAWDKLLLLARLREKLDGASVSGTPLLDLHAELTAEVERRFGPRAAMPPHAAIALGSLLLRSADSEREALGPARLEAVRRRAAEGFVAALGVDAAAGARLFEALGAQAVNPARTPLDREDGAGAADAASAARAIEYAVALLTVARAYLLSDDFERILEDDSRLELARRMRDGCDAERPAVRLAFVAAQGLACIKAGEDVTGTTILDAFIDELPEAEAPLAALGVAERILRAVPGSPHVLRYVDRYRELGGKPLDLLDERIEILAIAREREDLTDGASRRLQACLEEAASAAASAVEAVQLARVAYRLEGPEAARRVLGTARKRFPGATEPSVALAGVDLEEAIREEASGAGGGAPGAPRADVLARAFELCIPPFVRAPAAAREAGTRIAMALRYAESAGVDVPLDAAVARSLPHLPRERVGPLAAALRACFSDRLEAAVENAAAAGSAAADPLDDEGRFLAYLRGLSRMGIAARAGTASEAAGEDGPGRGDGGARAEVLARAREEFLAAGDFVASRIEIFGLDLGRLGPTDAVPEDLLAALDPIASHPDAGASGYRLQAALHRKELLHLVATGAPRADMVKALQRAQGALRRAIRRDPLDASAYLALAESHAAATLDELLDVAPRGARLESILPPSYPKAINVLRAAPEASLEVSDRLASYYELSGDAEKAKRFLEHYVLARPSSAAYLRLFSNYLRTSDPRLRSLLADDSGGRPGSETTGAGADDTLGRLREGFLGLPEHPGLRLLLLAMEKSESESAVVLESARSRLRKEVTRMYRESIAAYESRGLEPPAMALNNLAWYLAEYGSPEEIPEALRHAERAVEASGGGRLASEARDTRGWVLLKAGRPEEARAVFRDLLGVADAPQFRYHLARALLDLGDREGALRELRSALQSREPFPDRKAAESLEGRLRRP